MTAFRTEQGLRQVTVIKVGSKMVDVDLNHPMAGLELTLKWRLWACAMQTQRRSPMVMRTVRADTIIRS